MNNSEIQIQNLPEEALKLNRPYIIGVAG
jgi:hypothetical protein